LTERTLEDIQRDFGTGARVQCTVTGITGIVLIRDNFGAMVLMDDKEQPLHYRASSLKGLPPMLTATETSRQRTAAVDCSSAASASSAVEANSVDPFDTNGLGD
jgi:hypothetical protein